MSCPVRSREDILAEWSHCHCRGFHFFPALTSISFFKQSLNMLPLNHRAFLSPAEIPVIRHAARIHSAPQSEITRVKSVSEGKTRNDRDQVM